MFLLNSSRPPEPPQDDDPNRYSEDPDDLSGSDAEDGRDELERPFGGREENFVSDDEYGDVDDFFDQENDDPNPEETREQRHVRRMRQAKDKLAREIGKEVQVNDTIWTVVSEHHRDPTPDTVGRPELVGFDFINFNLLRLFRHMYPGVPEDDIRRANSVMAHRYSQWREITAREWFLWHGLFIAATLYGGQVRRAPLPTPRDVPEPPCQRLTPDDAPIARRRAHRAPPRPQRASADVRSSPRDARRALRCGPPKPTGWSQRRTSDSTASRTPGSWTSSRLSGAASR